MGFFSSLRKIWSKDKPETDKPGTPKIGAQAVVLPETDWQQPLAAALSAAEPSLSVWLGIALGGVKTTGDLLWSRLRFLLTSLEAPQAEAEKFVDDFRAWATDMEYEQLEDFRSELQYRLALALDMEDEEDERNRLFIKLSDALERTRAGLGRSFNSLISGHGELTPSLWEELEELFIMADMGASAAHDLASGLRKRAESTGLATADALRALLSEELSEIFRAQRRVVPPTRPQITLLIGVNGTGKTTTVAKLAYRARMQGKSVLLVAADTFRAAAVEQLGLWSTRTGSDFFSKGQGAEPAAVAWEGMDKALAGNYDEVFVDTAGRLHTKVNLMDELKKVRDIIGRKIPGAPHRTVLIIDATNGQNALAQARIFKDNCQVNEIILTKLDGTAKGGIAISVVKTLGIPITFVGLGEKMEDLRPFDGKDFARALFGAPPQAPAGGAAP
jgi:fused signal recognition particle receptor